MKTIKSFSIVFFSVLVVFGFTFLQKDSFYYAFDEKITIVPIKNKIVIRYESNRNHIIDKLFLPETINGEQIIG